MTLRSTVMSRLSAATPGRSIWTHTSLPRRKASIGIATLPFDDRPSRPNSASKSRKGSFWINIASSSWLS
jgi:hypothetical protein